MFRSGTLPYAYRADAVYDKYTDIKMHKLLTLLTYEVLCIFVVTLLSST